MTPLPRNVEIFRNPSVFNLWLLPLGCVTVYRFHKKHFHYIKRGQSSLKCSLFFRCHDLFLSLCGFHNFQDFRDITLVCEDGWKSNTTGHSVPGILPDTDEQGPWVHIQPHSWLLILLLFGHQDEDHFTGNKEEEEESVNHEKKLEEERRLLEKERSWGKGKFDWHGTIQPGEEDF